MAILLNFFDNVILQAITEEIVPKRGFFKDRYFPTGAGDIFKADEVLTEYRKGDRKLAAFVAPDVHDIPIARRGYEVHSYQPAYIAPSRVLTMDELKKRGFGEALYPGMDEAQRAARLLADDMNDMENRIAGTEEWMAAQTMISNGCTMQEMIDGKTKGNKKIVRFYDNKSDHTYTVAKKWNATGGDFWADIKAMCRMLSYRGLPAKDLILGTDAADYILADEKTRQLLDKNSGIIVGEIRQQLTQYDGVVFIRRLLAERVLCGRNLRGRERPGRQLLPQDRSYGYCSRLRSHDVRLHHPDGLRPDRLHHLCRKARGKAGRGPGRGQPQTPSGMPPAGRTKELLPLHLRSRCCAVSEKGATA